jgi:hypothetical protein
LNENENFEETLLVQSTLGAIVSQILTIDPLQLRFNLKRTNNTDRSCSCKVANQTKEKKNLFRIEEDTVNKTNAEEGLEGLLKTRLEKWRGSIAR